MDNINLENKEALQQKLETLRAKDGFICDMDGVIYHGNRLLPGVKEFVDCPDAARMSLAAQGLSWRFTTKVLR